MKSAGSFLGPLPYEGEIFPSARRRYSELVLLVPHFGGHKKSLLGHIKLLNELGFDVASFELCFERHNPLPAFHYIRDRKIGWRHVWAQQITDLLNRFADRKKIIFSFSYPSSSALFALGSRKARDVTAWICDGGPFLEVPRGIWNHFVYIEPTPNRIWRMTKTVYNQFIWGGYHYGSDLQSALNSLPKGFPVLNIRGWKDRLVSPGAIEKVFQSASHLHLETLSLPEADHLQGLKAFPEIYKPRIQRFLEDHAQVN